MKEALIYAGLILRGDLLTKILEFLGISKQKWTKIIECTVRTSLEGLAYIHRMRFSNAKSTQQLQYVRPESNRCKSRKAPEYRTQAENPEIRIRSSQNALKMATTRRFLCNPAPKPYYWRSIALHSHCHPGVFLSGKPLIMCVYLPVPVLTICVCCLCLFNFELVYVVVCGL